MKLTTTYKELLNEYYDSEKLYDKNVIVSRLQRAPKYMRVYIKGLDDNRQCLRGDTPYDCTRIPQVVYEYLFGSSF
jgi:hypothetical protein